jgi:hypothetical protein
VDGGTAARPVKAWAIVANPSCTAAVLPALSSNSRIIACLNMFSTKHEAGTGFVLCILFIYDFFFAGMELGAALRVP